MALAIAPRSARQWWRFDLSTPLLAVLGIFLCGLVLLPLGWLGWYSVTDASAALSLTNFRRLATDSTFVRPYLTALIVAASVAAGAALVATPLAWLVARTDLPLRGTVRALVTASFVTPPFLGAIAWEILAAPNSGILNQWYRAVFALGPYEHLFDIYTAEGLVFVMSCYSSPYVFVLLANALDNIPSELEDASAILGGTRAATLQRVTLPMVLPALLAGGLVAFLQALTQFGTPAILALPAGFHVITTKISALFQYPPNPHLAAAAALPLLLLTILLLRGRQWLLGRRGYAVIAGKGGTSRLVALGIWRWPALLFAIAILALPVFFPYAALIKTALVRTPSDPLTFDTLTFHNIRFVFFDFSQTRQALWNTVLLGVLAATGCTFLALIVALRQPAAWLPDIAFSGFLRPHRSLSRASFSGSVSFSVTPGRRWCCTARYGSCSSRF
jgi:iron(III) transport system permease protein